jgi:hypothetical protein
LFSSSIELNVSGIVQAPGHQHLLVGDDLRTRVPRQGQSDSRYFVLCVALANSTTCVQAWAGLMFTFVAMFAKIYFDVKSKAVPNK